MKNYLSIIFGHLNYSQVKYQFKASFDASHRKFCKSYFLLKIFFCSKNIIYFQADSLFLASLMPFLDFQILCPKNIFSKNIICS